MRIRNLCAAAALVVLVWSPTAARAETGYANHSDIVFKGTISRVEDDRIQVKTASGPRLWVSPAADFSLGGDLVHVDELQVGDEVTVAVDGGDSAVLRLNARTVTLQTDDGPTEIPVSLLGDATLNGSQVTVRLPDGQRQVVSMRRALDLVRHRGAGLVAVAAPTPVAAAPGPVGRVSLRGVELQGTVRSTNDNMVRLDAGGGSVATVPGSFDFTTDGDAVAGDRLRQGTDVVARGTGFGTVVALDAGNVTLRTEGGDVTMPVAMLGDDIRESTMVRILDADGEQDVVTLDEAIDLAGGAAGVRILAEAETAQVGGSDIVNGAPAGSADLVASGTAIARADDDLAEGVGAAGGESREDDFDNAVSNRPTGSGTLPSRGTGDVDSTTASISRPTDDQVGAAANPGTATAPSTGAQTGLGTLSSSSTAPSAGLGSLSTSSTGTQVGVGTLNASGSDSEPVDEVVLRGSDSATATPVGHLNLTATQVLGTIVEAGESEVVLQTATGRRMSVPAHFRMVGADGPAQNLSPDMDVTVELPEDSGPIVAVGEGTVSVQLSSGLVILPLELLPYSTVTDTRVYVEMANGNMQIMNLGDALLQIRLGYAEFEAR